MFRAVFFILKKIIAFLWIGVNCLKAKETVQEDSLLLIPESPGVSGTHLSYFGRMKG